MGVKSVNQVDHKRFEPQPEVAKPKPQTELPQSQQGKDSKIGDANFASSNLKFRLQNMAIIGNNPVQSSQLTLANVTKKEPDGVARKIFTDGNQGVEPGTQHSVSPANPNATPEEAAHFLKTESLSEGSKVSLFTDGLEAHKNDPTWTKNFFAALGPDESAKLISNTVNPGSYAGYPNVARDNARTVVDALDMLQKNGSFTGEDMDALVGTMQKNGFNPYVATDLFANASPGLKEAFVKSAIQNGDDTLDAAASHVLATMTGAKQAEILSGLGDKLEPFIQGAMAKQFDMVSLSDKIRNPNAGPGEVTPVTFGGVEKLLSASADKSLPYPPYAIKSPFPPELQDKMFNAVSSALTNPDIFDNFKDNTSFKDALGNILQTNFDRLVNGDLKNDGVGGEDLSTEFRAGYSKALELTLFTPPPGSNSRDFMSFLNNKYTGMANDMRNLSDHDFVNKYGTERGAFARTHGQLTGLLFKAMNDGLSRVKGDAEAQGQILETAFNFGAAIVGGTGQTPATSIFGSVASELIGTVGEQVAKDFAEGRYKEAIEGLKQNGINPEDMITSLYHQVHDDSLPNATAPNGTQRLPDGSSVVIKDAWQNGYDNIAGAPEVPN